MRQGNLDALLGHERGKKAADAMVFCPYCHEQGGITTYRGKARKGISGGKATAAIMTLGLSLVVAGLSRKESTTLAYCGWCRMEWYV